MKETISCNIILPEKMLFFNESDMIVVPGAEGEFAIMSNHIPLISLLKAGIVYGYKSDLITDKVFISNGFVEVVNNNCNILVTEAINLYNLDIDVLEEKIAATNEKLQTSLNSDKYFQLENELAILNDIKSRKVL